MFQLIDNGFYLAHHQLLDTVTGAIITITAGVLGWIFSRRATKAWIRREQRKAAALNKEDSK